MAEIMSSFNMIQYLIDAALERSKTIVTPSALSPLNTNHEDAGWCDGDDTEPNYDSDIESDDYKAIGLFRTNSQLSADSESKVYPYDKYDNIDKITFYDNVGLQNTSVLVANHMINSKFRGSRISSRFGWIANTQIPTVTDADDTIDLYKNYEEEGVWVGYKDTSTLEGIDAVMTSFEEHEPRIDLFISDKNVELKKQFDKQEELHAQTHYGQVCLAMGILAQKGCAIFKQFTSTSICIIYLIDRLAECFDTVNMCKPESSKQDNSEVYLVCMGFKKERGRQLYLALREEMKSFSPDNYGHELLSSMQFLKSIYQASQKLIEHQISVINTNLANFEEYNNKPFEMKKKLSESNRMQINAWFKRMAFLPLDSRDWLHVKNNTEYQIRAQKKDENHPQRTGSDNYVAIAHNKGRKPVSSYRSVSMIDEKMSAMLSDAGVTCSSYKKVTSTISSSVRWGTNTLVDLNLIPACQDKILASLTIPENEQQS
jgi:23S rRNA U2552 (ribose-2'-O)-methylase RlmE/FtsJ